MTEPTYTIDNLALVQEFIEETRKRISDGVEITFTRKASSELNELALDFHIEVNDIEEAMLNLSTDNYYRGIDSSNSADFNVCAFCTNVGVDKVQFI